MKIVSIFLFIAVAFFSQGCGKDKDSTPAVDANFSISGYENPVPCTISFINTSSNATNYLWNFGDGSTSTISNPTHTYTLAGSYLLTLKATGPDGEETVCKLLTVEPAPAANKSAFSYFFDKCTGYPVGALFKTVNPASTNTVWDFGNGVINVNRDPIVQFLVPGDYTVKYSSLLNGVRDTVVRIIRIQ
jgi:PKD repeat protein